MNFIVKSTFLDLLIIVIAFPHLAELKRVRSGSVPRLIKKGATLKSLIYSMRIPS